MTESVKSIKNDVLKIKYKGKIHKINVTKELEVNPSIINSQLEQAPSNYAFFCLLREKYTTQRDKLQEQMDYEYNKAWVFYKESGNVSNDLADHKAAIHKNVVSLSDALLELKETVNKLTSICKAYESRDRILQTISANLRKS